LIVLLIMVTLLTIGLSLISHSITDVSLSKDEEESMRSFSAAEAGIEELLREAALVPGEYNSGDNLDIDIEGANISVNVTEENDDLSRDLEEGEIMNIDLDGLGEAVELNIEWDDGAAIEMVVYQADGGMRKSNYYSPASSCTSNFTLANLSEADLALVVGDDLLRIRALCNETNIAVTINSGTLPVQEYTIESRAAVGGTEESKSSAVGVSKTNPALPPIFDYVLFSGGVLE